jgi:hypothetical protein
VLTGFIDINFFAFHSAKLRLSANTLDTGRACRHIHVLDANSVTMFRVCIVVASLSLAASTFGWFTSAEAASGPATPLTRVCTWALIPGAIVTVWIFPTREEAKPPSRAAVPFMIAVSAAWWTVAVAFAYLLIRFALRLFVPRRL